ncbi:GntR family transcriptional regulator [Paraburkholderia tropica]|uniref:Transcriptional regulator, GntR family n=1 Tax=Paraburkholderia tropica TaxID=92647 RepID=A0A1A5XH12_9BURK|nr:MULTISPECIES: GntR family transcriptional regulator [Paraburkholderia]MBB2983701.1 DNA-binding GntR family transcriptional regulator [Paraburkholderia tropica]OBR52629.1 GntR family transcriptional regulator [Paraburkholderia tropica]RQM46443.1 GntR family transcriptional regulator [Paraburkholderia bannensis]RQN34541.1 GntR family transcriptional regulator [Paraburkholderia tropica]SEK11869.1 transcriptional regulator, GntR family [Paraburkholderia tropica]
MPDIKLNLSLHDSPPSAPIAADAALTRADRVYYTLRNEIFDMHLLPGDRLTEGAIAERFAVSRTPAREALQRLQSDGLMQGYVRGGWEVVPIDNKRFDDLYEMRQMIETFAVRKLCSGEAPQAELHLLLDALDRTWKVGRAQRIADGHRLVELDEALHHALVAAAGNDELTATMQRVTDRIRVVRRLDLVHGDGIAETYDEHAAILDAVRRGDSALSVELVSRHIGGSQASVNGLTLQRLRAVRTDTGRDAVAHAPARPRRTT